MRRYFTRVNQAKVLKYAREIVERGLQVRTLPAFTPACHAPRCRAWKGLRSSAQLALTSRGGP